MSSSSQSSSPGASTDTQIPRPPGLYSADPSAVDCPREPGIQQPSDIHGRILRAKAAMLVASCPGDWDTIGSRKLREDLQSYAAGEMMDPHLSADVRNVILYRFNLAMYVDFITASFNLPKAQNRRVLDWDKSRFLHSVNRRGERWEIVIHTMISSGLQLHDPDEGPPFGRPHLYLANCIWQSSLDLEDIHCLIKQIGKFVRKGKTEVF